jgi:hypothetical protein
VKTAYSKFLVTLPSLRHIAMMKTTVGYLEVLKNTEQVKIVPTLRILELSMMAEIVMYDNYDFPRTWPISEIRDLLMQVLTSRQTTPGGTVVRLHLQPEEWRVTKVGFDLLEKIRSLDHPPLVYWDADVPFFQDFYDSIPI